MGVESVAVLSFHPNFARNYPFARFVNGDLPLSGGNGDRHSFIRGIAFDIHKGVVMNFVGGFTEGIVEVAENLLEGKTPISTSNRPRGAERGLGFASSCSLSDRRKNGASRNSLM